MKFSKLLQRVWPATPSARGFGFGVVLICSVSLSAHASLLDLFPYSNINKPDVWKDQLGGFATGGSIHARAPASNLKLLHLDLPSFKGGCGGIDLFGGGFGYIDSAKLEPLIKNIGTSALSYALMLTIKSISPQISDLLENLEAIARFINGQNINSCQMGASIASGLFPKTEASQELACNARKMGSSKSVGGQMANYFTARYDCQNPVTKETEANADPSLLGTKYNLVWKALAKMTGTTGAELNSDGTNKASGANTDLSIKDKEFLMSISGTLIAKPELEHKGSLVRQADLLNTLVFGSSKNTLEVYQCDESTKCLNPQKVSIPFKETDSVVYKVRLLLDAITKKIIHEDHKVPTGEDVSEGGLTPDEKFLATTTSIPIIKLIALHSGLKGHGVSLATEEYAEAVAFDYVTNYLDTLVDFVYLALANLEHTQTDGDKIKAFKEEIRHVKQMLYRERTKALQRLDTLLSVKRNVQMIEKNVLSQFIEYRG